MTDVGVSYWYNCQHGFRTICCAAMGPAKPPTPLRPYLLVMPSENPSEVPVSHKTPPQMKDKFSEDPSVHTGDHVSEPKHWQPKRTLHEQHTWRAVNTRGIASSSGQALLTFRFNTHCSMKASVLEVFQRVAHTKGRITDLEANSTCR